MENETFLNLSERAIVKIREFGQKMPEAAGKYFRVFVQGGGCSGFSYGFVFDEKREDDHEVAAGDQTCLIDPQSALYLKGCTIDFVEALTGAGFAVENPNATGSCGCGHSFSV